MLISLSDYGYEREQNRVTSLLEFLPRWLSEQRVTHAAALTDNLSAVLLLLDGLDELRSAEARRSVLTEVEELLRDERVGGVVVTGRSFLADELTRHDLCLLTTTVPSQAKAREFVRNFVRLRRGDDAHAEALVARIKRDPDLDALSRTPLMLAFMVVLDELEGRLPDRRIEIYYRLGEMLVERWTRARSIGASANQRERPTRADALRVLGPLAWWTVERGGGAVGERALLREIQRIEARREAPTEAQRRAAALLELLRADTALLVPLPGHRWSFVHQSIGEYFAGVEAERTPERWRALLDDPFRAEWREIVLFCAGQLGVIDGRTSSLDQLVGAVLEKSRRRGRYDAKYPSLLIGLLAESPGLSRDHVRKLCKRLLQFVFETAFSELAKRQAQSEFVSLLRGAHGTVRVELGEQLQKLFRSRAVAIRWDRIFIHDIMGDSGVPLRGELSHFKNDIIARIVMGPLLTAIFEWKTTFQIDLEPTLRTWSSSPSWTRRFAHWWIHSQPADRSRTVGEISDELVRR